MQEHALDDGVVRLREWADDDVQWYADSARDPLIQRFTTDSPTLDAAQVLAAFVRTRKDDSAEGLVICDSVTGRRLGNIALTHDGQTGVVSYWVAADARGRGVGSRALALYSSWAFESVGLNELWLAAHRDNVASQHVALRAGFRRDPEHDKSMEVKGAIWPMLGYALPRSGLLAESLVQVSEDPDVRLFVAQTAGPANRVLLVIHGGPDWDHTYLREPLTQLGGAHRVVFADLRGCGRSTAGLADDQYTPDAVVADLLGLLDALGVDRADVLGFSYGGMIAQRLTVAAPERVRRLIIASSSIPPVPADAYDDRPEAAALRDTSAPAWADDPSPELVRADAVGCVAANVWLEQSQEELLRRLAEVRFSAEWARPFLAEILPPARPQESQARLAALGIPILLLHGRQDLTFPAKLAEQVAAEVPGARAVILDQAGHMAHIDQPEAWLAVVAGFLDED